MAGVCSAEGQACVYATGCFRPCGAGSDARGNNKESVRWSTVPTVPSSVAARGFTDSAPGLRGINDRGVMLAIDFSRWGIDGEEPGRGVEESQGPARGATQVLEFAINRGMGGWHGQGARPLRFFAWKSLSNRRVLPRRPRPRNRGW